MDLHVNHDHEIPTFIWTDKVILSLSQSAIARDCLSKPVENFCVFSFPFAIKWGVRHISLL